MKKIGLALVLLSTLLFSAEPAQTKGFTILSEVYEGIITTGAEYPKSKNTTSMPIGITSNNCFYIMSSMYNIETQRVEASLEAGKCETDTGTLKISPSSKAWILDSDNIVGLMPLILKNSVRVVAGIKVRLLVKRITFEEM